MSENKSVRINRIFVNKVLNKISRNPLSLPEGFTVTCHAGALKTENNTVASIEKLIEYGAQVVEIDVSFRPDGTVCVIHKDEPSQNEGAEFDAVLNAVAKSDKCKINLDLKSIKNLPAVDKSIEKYNLSGRAFFTGVGENWCKTVSENSSLPYYLNDCAKIDNSNPEKNAEMLCRKIIDCGAIGLNCHYSGVSETLCRALHKNGLLLSVWTADKKIIQCKLLAAGVDNITTKRPDVLEYCIKHWGGF